MGKIAFVFPGQGSQAVGMGKELYENSEEARKIFDEADSRLGEKLTDIMFEGPQETLTLTYNAQPALLTTSIAVLEYFKKNNIEADFVAGHSLGEYSALVAAGVLQFSDAVYAVRKRGEFMEEAVPAGVGAMSAVLGMDASALKEVTDEVTAGGNSVQLANLNCPGQIVISGTAEGVEKAGTSAKDKGAKRVIPLDVSGPFHSELMKPAAEKFEAVLNELQFEEAKVPVIANVTAKPVHDVSEIKTLLVEQLYSPVRWEESVKTMVENGVTTFIEIGHGKVLSGLVKKIDRSLEVLAISDLESVQAAVEKLKGE
ncbi:ACP S-malonyltransferase [Metabacillus fastidiosus]|uniref:Malonyl CoA-acyl carrier protein transacylase n=1 Tax=Metabacillus fastidiosus TaxID=1458 RepID=A0ABU6NYW3_9BACI|nr:ACP S-malonyltransferase [Metabacillus fastidiosus]MED4401567.1 ACP S-malonyltransferase [Metabacillus fastidiosus]MED4452864.1 ACP S-malonyltransferase [Metabacillus fastidiosus]